MRCKKRKYNKKLRFQLLQEWLTHRYEPAKVLDVGGGKGLLSYLLQKNGWQATVVDPVDEGVYHTKYKDLLRSAFSTYMGYTSKGHGVNARITGFHSDRDKQVVAA